RILDGAQKKYEMLHHQKTEVDFIKSIQKTNRKPYKIPYKNMSFLANKFVIEINEDAVSQDLAYIMLSTGVLEKNAIGMGFCKAM
ncbi:MAG: CRISPR-associated endoribonuclease Cas6, partial [Bacilli bacterium]